MLSHTRTPNTVTGSTLRLRRHGTDTKTLHHTAVSFTDLSIDRFKRYSNNFSFYRT